MRKLTYEEIARNRHSISDFKKLNKLPVTVILDNIRSMWNVGSVFRSSDAARVEKLILCGMTATPPRKEIDKTALGSTNTVQWQYYSKTVDAIKWLKHDGIPIVALEHTSKSISFWDYDWTFPTAVIIGHEVEGIGNEVCRAVDASVELPMYGNKQSLNVSVAYGILIYELLRKYVQNYRF